MSETRTQAQWQAANNGTGKRIWFVMRGEGSTAEYLWTHPGTRTCPPRPTTERLVRFASYEAAQRRADQLNAELP
jgi:hypothetical protein